MCRKLLRNTNELAKVLGAREETKLTIPWNLVKSEVLPGIIMRQHHTDQKQMGLLRENNVFFFFKHETLLKRNTRWKNKCRTHCASTTQPSVVVVTFHLVGWHLTVGTSQPRNSNRETAIGSCSRTRNDGEPPQTRQSLSEGVRPKGFGLNPSSTPL